jgi:hypothetical protein
MSRYLIIYGEGTDQLQLELVDSRDLGSDFDTPEALFSKVVELHNWYKHWDLPPLISYYQASREDGDYTVYREAASGDFQLLGHVVGEVVNEGVPRFNDPEP